MDLTVIQAEAAVFPAVVQLLIVIQAEAAVLLAVVWLLK